MDVFAAVNTRIACRAFLDKPVDLNIVRELIVRAQRAASGGNLQSWNVYALANKPLADFKRIVAERIARDDPRHAKSEYPIYPELMFGPLGLSLDSPPSWSRCSQNDRLWNGVGGVV
jgi:nitroreductase